jgi:RNA polymerase sigma factor (sigma-70 family)
MADGQLNSVLRYIRKTVVPASPEDCTDGQLLECVIGRQDEAAFTALLRRHGPMVLGVCRRLLHHTADAEDAFQATWLVLLHRARSIRKREALGSWLYGVAYRTALKARAEVVRRRVHEGPLREVPIAPAIGDLAGEELRAELDAEVNRLPLRYRAPVVLCYFESKTYTEAAQALGVAAGTVASRLARARALLRKRLAHRGLTLSAGLLATLLALDSWATAVPGALVNSSRHAAAAITAGQSWAVVVPEPILTLTKGVVKTMLLTRLTTLAAVLLMLGIAGAGAGLAFTHVPRGQATDQPQRVGEIEALRKELQDAKQEIEQLKQALRLARQVAGQTRPKLYRGKPISYWVEQLSDGDPSYRKEAVGVLGVISQDDRTVIEPLLATLRDKDETVRLAAVSGLGQAGAPAVSPLIALLREEGPLRTLAALALANIGEAAKAAVPALIETLGSRDPQARQAAASALGRMGPAAKRAIPVLIEALQKDRDNRQVVGVALGQIDPETQKILPTYAYFATEVHSVLLEDKTKDWQKAIEELQKKYPPRSKGKAPRPELP